MLVKSITELLHTTTSCNDCEELLQDCSVSYYHPLKDLLSDGMSDTKKPTNPERTKKDAFDILDKRVKIYRTASKVWQMQMGIRQEGKYFKKSAGK